MGRGTDVSPKQPTSIYHRCKGTTLELDPTTLLKPSVDCWCGQHLDYSFMRCLETESLSQASFRFLIQRSCERNKCFLLLSATDWGNNWSCSNRKLIGHCWLKWVMEKRKRNRGKVLCVILAMPIWRSFGRAKQI